MRLFPLRYAILYRMKAAAFAVFLAVFSSVAAGPFLGAQSDEAPGAQSEDETGSLPFVFGPMLRMIDDGAFSWRPDWLPCIPPDAFTLLNGASPLITVHAGDRAYSLRLDSLGRLAGFPWPFGGGMAMVEAAYVPESGESGAREGIADDLAGLVIHYGEGGSLVWRAVCGDPQGAERLFTVTGEGGIFFVMLKKTDFLFSETWYDPRGRAVGYAETLVDRAGRVRSVEIRDGGGTRTETYSHEGGGRISGIEWSEGRRRAVYGRGLPLYWEYTPAAPPVPVDAAASAAAVASPAGSADAGAPADGTDAAAIPEGPEPLRYSFQWDERGFLVRMYGEGADYRYSYDTDERGNWIVRRETSWDGAFGLLVPVSRREISREITYGDSD
jgi:hypothetical protein